VALQRGSFKHSDLEIDMIYEDRDTLGMYAGAGPDGRHGPGPEVMGAATLVGNDVYNMDNEDVGEIEEIMLDMRSGRVDYAVLSFGGFLGVGKKLFAVPWNALELDTENKRFTLNVAKERLEQAPGFDRDHWPDMADESWAKEIHSYYGIRPYSGDARA
jgi:sporulation protein YlmC with PRC-barrel domain